MTATAKTTATAAVLFLFATLVALGVAAATFGTANSQVHPGHYTEQAPVSSPNASFASSYR